MDRRSKACWYDQQVWLNALDDWAEDASGNRGKIPENVRLPPGIETLEQI